MSDFTIDKHIPMPNGRYQKYPFGEMDVGDSFFVPPRNGEPAIRQAKRVDNAAYRHAQAHGGRFTVRTVDGGARCWRIA